MFRKRTKKAVNLRRKRGDDGEHDKEGGDDDEGSDSDLDNIIERMFKDKGAGDHGDNYYYNYFKCFI